MKAVIEFNHPEDERNHMLALMGQDIVLAIQAFDNWLRDGIKYGDLDERIIDTYTESRAKLYAELQERDVAWLVFDR